MIMFSGNLLRRHRVIDDHDVVSPEAPDIT